MPEAFNNIKADNQMSHGVEVDPTAALDCVADPFWDGTDLSKQTKPENQTKAKKGKLQSWNPVR